MEHKLPAGNGYSEKLYRIQPTYQIFGEITISSPLHPKFGLRSSTAINNRFFLFCGVVKNATNITTNKRHRFFLKCLLYQYQH